MSALPQLQTNNKTFLGRHWSEHSLLSRYFPGGKGRSILSFGCSTGEELMSLHALFPSAELYGCDVDWFSLQTARGLLGSRATIFQSDSREIEACGPYDIIVCNSVLLAPSTVQPDGKKKGIDPALWQDIVSLLDANLKPGGIIQIINSNMPFRLHPLAGNYQPLRSALVLGPNFVDQFDLEGRHLCSGVGGVGWSAIVSRHLAEEHWPALQPTDLTDIHFFKTAGADRPSPAVINDEIIPNLPQNGIWAKGSASYSPFIYPDEGKVSTRTEVDITWTTLAIDTIRLERTARRYWFDGELVDSPKSTIEMYGPTATAFIESMLGKRSTRMTVDSMLAPETIRAPQF